jgi:hypothetical protein
MSFWERLLRAGRSARAAFARRAADNAIIDGADDWIKNENTKQLLQLENSIRTNPRGASTRLLNFLITLKYDLSYTTYYAHTDTPSGGVVVKSETLNRLAGEELVRRKLGDITDQKELAKIALNDRRLVAIIRMAGISETARRYPDRYLLDLSPRDRGKIKALMILRSHAVKMINDEILLAKIATEAIAYGLKHQALEKLSDQTALVKVAVKFATDADLHLATAAIDKVTDQALLVSFLAALDDDVVLAARARISPAAIVSVIHDPMKKLIGRALETLKDQHTLTALAIGAARTDVGTGALRKLNDRAALSKVAASAKNLRTRDAASAKIAS